MDKNLIQRLIFGLLYVLVITFCTTPGGAVFLNGILGKNIIAQEYLYIGLISFFMLIGVWESVRLTKLGNNFWKWLAFPTAVFVFYRYAIRYFNGGFYMSPTISDYMAVFLVIIAVVTLFRYPNELYEENGKFIFTVIYVSVPFGISLSLPTFISGVPQSFSPNVFYLFLLIWSSDSFAYVFGRLFGKHKMASKISPKKTWEGFAGGFVCTIILGFVVGRYIHGLTEGWNWTVIGGIVAIFAPLGDLVESQLKRNFGVKDSSNIIPGHGGILDRLDSFIICVPAVYLYLALERFFL